MSFCTTSGSLCKWLCTAQLQGGAVHTDHAVTGDSWHVQYGEQQTRSLQSNISASAHKWTEVPIYYEKGLENWVYICDGGE